MKGKLIKETFGGVDHYTLFTDSELIPYAKDGSGHGYMKLSIKNCEAIANGYDLKELANKFANVNGDYDEYYRHAGFIKGFQKALEILGNKKFSEDDMINMYILGGKYKVQQPNSFLQKGKDIIQSLHTNEWDVEICNIMDCIGGNTCNGTSFECNLCTNTGVPKLDENDCLILKKT